MAQPREIQYLNRDYTSLKQKLIEFVQVYFPDHFQDFSENSPSMSLLEVAAYVGEILSFYQDRNFNEVFLEKASEFKNVISLAKNQGFKYRGKKPSYVSVDLTAIFASSSERQSLGFILNKESQFTTKINPSIIFETLNDVDFSIDDDNTITTLSANQYFVTKKNVNVVSGFTKTFQVSIGQAEQFLKIKLPDKDIFSIVNITDSNQNYYYEVNALSQDLIMTSIPNYNSSSSNVSHNLQLKYVPRRFITQTDAQGFTTLVFGSGIKDVEDFDFIPSPQDYTINQTLLGRNDITISNVLIENFLTTNSLGHAPNNTLLTIKYTVGGGKENNVSVGTITKLLKGIYTAKNSLYQNDNRLGQIATSITSYNSEESSGGDDADNIDDIKYISPKYFSAQGRVNTLPDFIATAKSMPAKYGNVYRCSAKVDSTQNNTVNLYILTKTELNGLKNFQLPNSILLSNLQGYFKAYRAYNDVINLKQANIIDIGVEYSIRVDSHYSNANEVAANTLYALKEYFDIKNWDIEQPIYLSRVSNVITNIRGVLAVYNLKIVLKNNGDGGRTYNISDFDVNKNIKQGTLICPPNSVFQVRYPLFDIVNSYIIE
jgi:hypothetical protein